MLRSGPTTPQDYRERSGFGRRREREWGHGGTTAGSIRSTHSCASTSSGTTESRCAARRRRQSMTARLPGARGGLFESANVRVNPSGDITVFSGSHSHGQGHETVFAQIVGDMLGVSSSLVEIVHGDTARSPFGLGTYGSRSAAVGGSAIAKAVGKIIDKGRKIAGYLLEASEQDIEFAAGQFTVIGTD